MKIVRLMALTTFLIGLHLFWRGLAVMSFDAFSGGIHLGLVILSLPILMLGTAHLVCSILLWRSPATGRWAMIPLGLIGTVIAVSLAGVHCVTALPVSTYRSEFLGAMWNIFVSMRDVARPSDFWIIGLWMVFLGNSLCVIVVMRHPSVVEWCENQMKVTAGSKGPRGFPVVTEEGADTQQQE